MKKPKKLRGATRVAPPGPPEGRLDAPTSPIPGDIKVALAKVPLLHGLDPAGSWYGGEQDLWEATPEFGKPFRVRAPTRAAARDEVRRSYPQARFYR